MKRTEMIKAITTEFTNKDRHYEVNQEVAELILNFIEAKGMLPPARWRSHDWHDLGITYAEWLQLPGKVKEWDLE